MLSSQWFLGAESDCWIPHTWPIAICNPRDEANDYIPVQMGFNKAEPMAANTVQKPTKQIDKVNIFWQYKVNCNQVKKSLNYHCSPKFFCLLQLFFIASPIIIIDMTISLSILCYLSFVTLTFKDWCHYNAEKTAIGIKLTSMMRVLSF